MITETDKKFMRRAIQLSQLGLSNTSPNPHVGAVVVANGEIIGEGFHRCCGQGHAEVNAIGSVAPENLERLKESTIYVTLEPCSHYGKTPPCAKLIIDKQLRRVVVGTGDPNPKVNGRGIEMIRNAGIEVELCDGEIEHECRSLDPKFMSRFINHRPFIALKWAQSADGFMAHADGSPARISTPLTSTLVHRLRSQYDAILTSSTTVLADNPRLDTRLFNTGNSPLRVVIDREGKVPANANIFNGDSRPTLVFTENPELSLPQNAEIVCLPEVTPLTVVANLSNRGINSILIEAGPTLLNAFISAGLFDVVRVETNPGLILGTDGGFPSPQIPSGFAPVSILEADGNNIIEYAI